MDFKEIRGARGRLTILVEDPLREPYTHKTEALW